MNTQPMRLLLIEDEVGDALKFSDCAKRRKDIKFVGMTDSSEEGLKLVKSRLPEGVILDLQLVKGKGSGLQFLENLNDMNLTLRPFVVVTTSNQSDAVYRLTEKLGADFFFSKTQQGYNEDFVVDTLLSLRSVIDTKQKKGSVDITIEGDLRKSRDMVESPDDRRERIFNRIDIELDLVGIRAKLKGRVYLRDSIYVQIHSKKERGSGIEEVAAMHKHTYASLVKTMQTAINDAWDNGDAEEIRTHFTARITAKNGVPYVSDFIHFYADKIRNSI
jgi:DNA-binding NarL/FixJ family response regulator